MRGRVPSHRVGGRLSKGDVGGTCDARKTSSYRLCVVQEQLRNAYQTRYP